MAVLRLASDEDFNAHVVRGLKQRLPLLDVVRIQDVGLRSADDPVILAWAAAEGRILLTHDRHTMTAFAYDRVRSGKPMPGGFFIRNRQPPNPIIDELLLIALCSLQEEWNGQVVFLPL
jgi:predicted nuclease of predicted toxin-antitoxin system